jgi:hypothetical protein
MMVLEGSRRTVIDINGQVRDYHEHVLTNLGQDYDGAGRVLQN